MASNLAVAPEPVRILLFLQNSCEFTPQVAILGEMWGFPPNIGEIWWFPLKWCPLGRKWCFGGPGAQTPTKPIGFIGVLRCFRVQKLVFLWNLPKMLVNLVKMRFRGEDTIFYVFFCVLAWNPRTGAEGRSQTMEKYWFNNVSGVPRWGSALLRGFADLRAMYTFHGKTWKWWSFCEIIEF